MDITKVKELMDMGFSTAQVSAMMSGGSTVASKKTGGKVEEGHIPIDAVDVSESVLNAERMFAGITTAKFGVWNNKLFLANEGTGGKQAKWNALFQPLSDHEGVVVPAEVIARCEKVKAAMEQHITVLETVQEWAKGLNPIQVQKFVKEKGKKEGKKKA